MSIARLSNVLERTKQTPPGWIGQRVHVQWTDLHVRTNGKPTFAPASPHTVACLHDHAGPAQPGGKLERRRAEQPLEAVDVVDQRQVAVRHLRGWLPASSC